MRTLGLKQAAAFLKMSPGLLQAKAKSGDIPGAKPGKRWVFLEDDLAAYIRSLYSARGQAPQSGSRNRRSLWEYENAVIPGTSMSEHPMDGEYADLLGLPTENVRRSTTTS
ncbi:MAG: helix-turn-helix domain-containing protein [Xanthomonadales bacterium]|jgi:hypothetical protein|nr:helix-turn-helix domain-containing protein [Xanthomonadales bacterium]